MLLTGLGSLAHGQILVSSHTYYAVANIIDTNGGVLASNSDSGSLLSGGSVATSITGTRSDYGVTTEHFGESALTAAASGGGISGSGSAHSRTTYVSGGNSFIGQATDSGFGQTVRFMVGSSGLYKANLEGIITTFHHSYEPDGPAGSFFYIFRLYSPVSGYLFNSEVQNSSTLANVPFTQTLTLTTGVEYELTYVGACNGRTVNYASQQAGSGAFGETAFEGSFSLQPVPEPTTIGMVGMGLAAAARRRKARKNEQTA